MLRFVLFSTLIKFSPPPFPLLSEETERWNLACKFNGCPVTYIFVVSSFHPFRITLQTQKRDFWLG